MTRLKDFIFTAGAVSVGVILGMYLSILTLMFLEQFN
ncbi:hypothetical protein UFOVP58_88 [uncultured Caudovirales phage]|uniref:Uncharacterized protein n=1 Tax=uncultured Caudovirales phage TaxID=2100421 RepID=A0A6J5KV68_9CAUD|nr:hypothetical protein UFOVP58_88 [uncultured Caudovirales phage]